MKTAFLTLALGLSLALTGCQNQDSLTPNADTANVDTREDARPMTEPGTTRDRTTLDDTTRQGLDQRATVPLDSQTRNESNSTSNP